MTITFESFKLEKNQHCTWDYLVIKNPYTKLCGDVIPSPITTSVQRLQMTFISDMVIPDDGFVLRININGKWIITYHYSTVCDPNHFPTYNKSAAVDFESI